VVSKPVTADDHDKATLANLHPLVSKYTILNNYRVSLENLWQIRTSCGSRVSHSVHAGMVWLWYVTHNWVTNESQMSHRTSHQWVTNKSQCVGMVVACNSGMRHEWDMNESQMSHEWFTNETRMSQEWFTNESSLVWCRRGVTVAVCVRAHEQCDTTHSYVTYSVAATAGESRTTLEPAAASAYVYIYIYIYI